MLKLKTITDDIVKNTIGLELVDLQLVEKNYEENIFTDSVKDVDYQLLISQKLSKEICDKLLSLDDNKTIFDVDELVKNKTALTTYDVEKLLKEEIIKLSEIINGEKFIITNFLLASVIQNMVGYSNNPLDNRFTNGQLYNIGKLNDIQLYCNPYMKMENATIFIGNMNILNFEYVNIVKSIDFSKNLIICEYNLNLTDNYIDNYKVINIIDKNNILS